MHKYLHIQINIFLTIKLFKFINIFYSSRYVFWNYTNMLKFEKDKNIPFFQNKVYDIFRSARYKKEMASMEMTGRTANQPTRDMPLLKATPDSLNSLSLLQVWHCNIESKLTKSMKIKHFFVFMLSNSKITS